MSESKKLKICSACKGDGLSKDLLKSCPSCHGYGYSNSILHIYPNSRIKGNLARKIVAKIFLNLDNRKGIGDAISEIDDDVLIELLSTLEKIVRKCLEESKELKGEL